MANSKRTKTKVGTGATAGNYTTEHGNATADAGYAGSREPAEDSHTGSG